MYPTVYHGSEFHYDEAIVPNFDSRKVSGTLCTEIDEGFASTNYNDYLIHISNHPYFYTSSSTAILRTDFTKNYIVPSSLTLNLSCSSVFDSATTRPLQVRVYTKETNNLIAQKSLSINSGLLNLSTELTILSRPAYPQEYSVEIGLYENYVNGFIDRFKVYSVELVSSGTIQAIESGIPLVILGGLDTSNYKRILAYDDNSSQGFTISDGEWDGGYVLADYAECYHRYDISGQFNTAYFQFNEGSGNVVLSGNKSGQVFSEDGKYRWLTDGAITDINALLERVNNNSISLPTVISGQYLDIDTRPTTQGNGLYIGPAKSNTYSTSTYYNESLSQLQGVDFYNPITSSGNFSLYLNMGYKPITQTTIDNGNQTEYDQGCTLFSTDSFETTIQGNLLVTRNKNTGNTVLTTISQPYSVINSLIHTYNSGLLTTYVLYEDNRSWEISSGNLPGLNCFGNIQIGRQGSTYNNYHYLTLHQFGICDYSLTRAETNSILEKINCPVNNVILNNGLHSVPTYASGDTWVGVSYQKSVKNNYDKTHLLTNRIIFDDSQVYSIPLSGYVFMDAYVAYTGNNPSGYLGITAQANVDGNNINPRWNTDSTFYQHKVFNSGGIQRITIGDIWEDTNPYPFNIGANTPQVNIFVTTPKSNSFYDGGEFRLYGLEFYTDSAFYVEPTGNVDGITLYTYGSQPSSGSLTLFCGQDEKFDTLNLFLRANEPVAKNNNVPLVVFNGGSGTTTNSCTLFAKNQPVLSGDLPLVTYSDYSPPNPISDNLNLFLHGGYYPSGIVSLYIKNDTKTSNKGINLFIRSANPSSGSLPLSIEGGGTDVRSGNLPLTVYSTTPINKDVSLFTHAGQAYSTLPLVVGSHSGLIAVDSVGLTIFSSAQSGFFGAMPLTLISDTFNSNMNLFIKNEDSNGDVGSLNLFIHSDNATNNLCTLYACNTNGSINSGVNFYIGGDGINQGAYVGTGSMNLFINRGNDSIGNGVTFNIAGPSGIISSVPLTISGGNVIANTCTLALPVSIGTPSGYTTLFSHGF